MNFLKQEVKNGEMVELARNNFSAPVNQMKKEVNKPDKFPSAAALVSTHDRNGPAGLLFMDGCIDLQSALFLLKTRLGYVLTGKQGVFEKCNEERDTVLNVISLLVKELPVNELWNLEKWEELEVIEKIEEKGENSYFLPHRPIVKDDSIATKIRPVFDASARATGQSSLIDLLHKGPNLIQQIPDILDRFRRYPIGHSADIEKAFLQLGITPKHIDIF
ncbi:DUF1758 domain-containing protein [Trichonephila clavipes]|nr:DUF1758 domain-containing protein [Trichonephila clavipes]